VYALFSVSPDLSLLPGQASADGMGVHFCIACRSAEFLLYFYMDRRCFACVVSRLALRQLIVMEGPMPQDSCTELRLAQEWQDTEAETENLLLDDIADTDSDTAATHDSGHAVKVGTEKSQRPGRIITKGQIQIHTRAAYELFYGRKSDRENGVVQIVGLVMFASLTNQLITLCREDDPYAEAVLIKLEKILSELETRIDELKAQFEEVLQRVEGMEIGFHESVRPISVPISFASPYGFIAARCLVKFDRVFLHTYSAKHAGLISQKAWHESVIRTRASFRNLFLLAKHYRFAGVTRNDLAANNAKARDAMEKYGELPESILQGTQRSRFARN
jgi:integrating conjugative element protein (TIGR03761 family)